MKILNKWRQNLNFQERDHLKIKYSDIHRLENIRLRKRGQIFVLIITLITTFSAVFCGCIGQWKISVALISISLTSVIRFYMKSLPEN